MIKHIRYAILDEILQYNQDEFSSFFIRYFWCSYQQEWFFLFRFVGVHVEVFMRIY